jgi:hypothetical protein
VPDILTGQDLFQMAQNNLGGYANAVQPEKLLQWLNEGKDEVWAILKANLDDFFLETTQSSDNTAANYFAPLQPGTRDYFLPSNFREIRNIECVTPGYELADFTYRKISDPEWREARKSANAAGAAEPNASDFLYTLLGTTGFRLAEYPPTQLDLRIDYVKWIPDFEADGTQIEAILAPFVKELANYAVKKAHLSLQDDGSFATWSQDWRASILRIAQATPRNQSDPVFVQDFVG